VEAAAIHSARVAQKAVFLVLGG